MTALVLLVANSALFLPSLACPYCQTPTVSPPSPKAPPSAGACPIDTLKLDACVDLLSGLVHSVIGQSAKSKCCPVIEGLADLDAALCLCTTIKAKALDVKVLLPIALELLIDCGKHDKKSLQLGPEDNLYVEGFASNLFAKADKQDRAGRADLNTAKTFYAASIFFEILYQFGELQPEKYAVWKAVNIRKALKEVRKPEPGPPGGDPDQSISSGLSSYTYGTQPSDGLPSSQQFDNASPQHIHKNSEGSEHFVENYRNADLPPKNADPSHDLNITFRVDHPHITAQDRQHAVNEVP
ncbi:hypothetical protein ZIOFF_056120 [Zingiber officinale]|uniref:Uncharacterized protein n=1 Tax=Zingiber officinale TaxID=94328 RepID=A0A8J5KF65_ZINOF|nr:hypothetical protein ZIOFF_056120 [Zingiber officinale]